jgi:predicted nucleic acid-binding protein
MAPEKRRMVVFDATMLLLLLRPESGRPVDSSGKPIEEVQARIAHLIQHIERARIRVIIPTPVLSEVLVHAGNAGPEIVEKLTRSTVFRVVPFDTLAAIEAALMTRAAIGAGSKRSGMVAPWAKVKFDRQIVAIAKVAKATMIYSDDADVRALATEEDIPVTGIEELPLPPAKRQQELPLVSALPQEQADAPPSEIEESTDDEEPEQPD